MAVDGHPLAPPTPFGRQAWLRERLEKEAKIKVSANAVHKWMHGTSRPREDTIRALARLLSVDELWLNMGRTPTDNYGAQPAATDPGATSGVKPAALTLAGLVQMAGASVVFAAKDEAADLYLDFGSGRMGVIAVAPEERQGSLLAVISEPVGDNRIVAILRGNRTACSVCLSVFDLTEVPRQNFGGYSVLSMEARKDGRLKVQGVKNLVSPLGSVEEVA